MLFRTFSGPHSQFVCVGYAEYIYTLNKLKYSIHGYTMSVSMCGI